MSSPGDDIRTQTRARAFLGTNRGECEADVLSGASDANDCARSRDGVGGGEDCVGV